MPHPTDRTDQRPPPPGRLFAFGLGYVATALASTLAASGWTVAGTVRDPDKATRLGESTGWDIRPWSGGADPHIAGLAAEATHILHSVPPGENGDPVLTAFGDRLSDAGPLAWLGYLSTTGVYGDRGGAWTDETVAVAPRTDRGRRRAAAERAWLDRAIGNGDAGLPVHVFRLSGIYGPGRSALDQLAAGRARRIVKPGHVTNRIHRDDIVAVLMASMRRPDPGAIYNLGDDAPAPSAAVVSEAARLLNVPPPPETAWDDPALGAMVRSFYGECKRLDNARIKRDLGVSLRYPSYREGLAAELARLKAAGQEPG